MPLKVGAGEENKIDLQQHLKEVRERNLDRTLDYQSIPDDLAIILIALDRTLGLPTFTKYFSRSECSSLAPADTTMFISKLWSGGIIADDPEKAEPGAYFLRDGAVWHYNDKVIYFVIPDAHSSNVGDSIAILSGRPFEDELPLRALWIDYAISECLAYLFSQCELHNLFIKDDGVNKIRSTLSAALKTHSVSEIWSAVWKMVKDAAALSRREYYNSAKAAVTIPGKLMRHLELVAKGKAELRSWDRPSNQPTGTIGQVFSEVFGVNENTRGCDLQEIFAARNTSGPAFLPPPVIMDSLRESIEGILLRTRKQGASAEMMVSFAEIIVQGLSFEDAIIRLEEQYPAPKARRSRCKEKS